MADDTSRRTLVTRWILIVTIALLIAVLGFLAWLFIRLRPAVPEAVSTTGQEYEWVKSIYGFGPSAEEQIYAPSSVAVGPDGAIYVTDPVRARVLIFAPTGQFERIVHTGAGATGQGQFIRPESIDVDDINQLYIADSWANKIIVFDVDGDFVREWPVDTQARGVDVVGDEVLVLGVGKVIIFDLSGIKLGEFGTRGPEPGQIDAYQGITADDERIYVADSLNRRIQAFARDGSLLWARPQRTGASEALYPPDTTPTVESTSAPSGELAWDLPQDLTFDAAGRLVVVDAFRFQLVVVDPETGEPVDAYGDFGRQDGAFYYPSSVAYDPELDWFVVADTQNNRVQIGRIPGSGGGVLEEARRVAASPSRFVLSPLLVPLGLILLMVVITILRRLIDRRADSEQDNDEILSDTPSNQGID